MLKTVWSSGRTYRISGGADAGMLDLACYSRAEGTTVTLADTAPVPSQEWRLEATGDGACRLVNAYTGARLAHDGHGHLVQTHTDQHADWRIEHHDLTTWRLRPDGGEHLLTATDNGLVLAPASASTTEGQVDPAQGWWLLPVPAPAPTGSRDTARPVVEWEALPGAADGGFQARLRLRNPGDAPARTGWRLSFDLPPEATDVTVDQGKVTALTARTPTGLHVELSGQDEQAAELAAGAEVECVLSGRLAGGDVAGAMPIGFRLDGTHLPAA
ncbi:RICIN domain-containing protein [Actinomadura kijaniata]|uniref:RICIN domain-containing protein n=1 Tax=Actinomadura kijaniata TaxID=46161 RepID=UPI003F199C0C